MGAGGEGGEKCENKRTSYSRDARTDECHYRRTNNHRRQFIRNDIFSERATPPLPSSASHTDHNMTGNSLKAIKEEEEEEIKSEVKFTVSDLQKCLS